MAKASVADAASVNSATIKAGTGAHGGVCKVADQAIVAMTSQTMVFTGCSLVRASFASSEEGLSGL